MILYHGTKLEIKEPKIFRNEIGRDFGFAFYTTDTKEQAERCDSTGEGTFCEG